MADTVETPTRRSTASTRKPRHKPVACRRCHSRKVKCPGGMPCSTCKESGLPEECVYPTRDRQIRVSQKYVEQLLKENRTLRDHGASNTPNQRAESTVEESSPARNVPEVDDSVRNPMVGDRAWFHPIGSTENPIRIGEAADAAFCTRFRQVIHDGPTNHIPRIHFMTDERLMSMSDIECPWPTPHRARFLVKVSLSTVCRTYHIVRKSSLLEGLEAAIRYRDGCDRLFICKLWALFALGELFSTRSPATDGSFPGLAYFAQSSNGLRVLSERPRVCTIEIMLLQSYYSFSLNRRLAAYYLSSNALRLGVMMGLNVNVPESQLQNRETREHRNRIWWTSYIFDRMWASSLGEPASIQDDDVEVDFPSDGGLTEGQLKDFGGTRYVIACIELARLARRIITSIYGRKVQTPFSQRVLQTLRDLRSWVGDLPTDLQLVSDDSSRKASQSIISLHVSFNQCVILTTRPVLLHVLRISRRSWNASTSESVDEVPDLASTLAEACIRCARHSVHLITESWIDGSFTTFDYFNVQYLFSAATILAISSILRGKDSQADLESFETAVQLLAELKQNGNIAAREFCQHVDAMKSSLQLASMPSRTDSDRMGDTSIEILSGANRGDNLASNGWPLNSTEPAFTTGMALEIPSLQDLNSQPDLGFIDASVYQVGETQGFYWPDISGEGLMSA